MDYKSKRKSEYAEKLKDPRWQKKRLEVLNRDDFRCVSCQDNTSTLHVHHKRYFGGKEPWDIDMKFLVTLCETCHQEETDLMPEVTSDLIEILKQSFFACDIKEIATSFIDFPIVIDPHYSAAVIKHFIGDANRFNDLSNQYMDYLSSMGSSKKDIEDFPL